MRRVRFPNGVRSVRRKNADGLIPVNDLAARPAGTARAGIASMSAISRLAAIPLLLALGACGSSPTAPSRPCRRYPVRYTEDGAATTCELGGLTLTCRASRGSTSWQYASLSDFIAEAQVPNLVLARERNWSGGGPMLISYGSHATLNTYEGLRLVTRVRTASNAFGSFAIDRAEYDHWDRLGRPTAGRITTGDTTEPLTLRYDDAARRVEASNGEYTVRDANGNVVEEAEFYGAPHVFIIQELAEVCQ